MSFERKNVGSGRSHLRNVWYSGVKKGTPAIPVTRTAEALQRLTLFDVSPPPAHQRSPTLPVDVQILSDDQRFVRKDLARLLERSLRKPHPKTAFSTHGSSEQLSENATE